MDLKELRNQIDAVDVQLVSLLRERLELSKQVAESKIQSGKPIYDHDREQEKLDSLAKESENKIELKATVALFEQIMAISREYQCLLISKNENAGD